MWNLSCSNRILDRKMKQEAHEKHLHNLRSVKSTLDNTAPKKFQFLYSRPKARQSKFEKQRSIETNNTILVERMLSTHSSVKPKDSVYFKDSLNNTFTKKKQRQIDVGNQMFVKRLQKATSQYSQDQIWKSSRKYMEFKARMANSRMDPSYDLQQPQSSTNFHSYRPNSAKR